MKSPTQLVFIKIILTYYNSKFQTLTEHLLNAHEIFQEFILYIILGAVGVLGAHIKKFFGTSLSNIHQRIDKLCDKMEQQETQINNLQKALKHLAEFEDMKIKTFHANSNFNRSLKYEIDNILDT